MKPEPSRIHALSLPKKITVKVIKKQRVEEAFIGKWVQLDIPKSISKWQDQKGLAKLLISVPSTLPGAQRTRLNPYEHADLLTLNIINQAETIKNRRKRSRTTILLFHRVVVFLASWTNLYLFFF